MANKKQTNLQLKPSRITPDQARSILKVALYVAVSAGVSYLISVLADQPELFGSLTPLVNIVLVAIKQVFSKQ